MRWVGKAMEMKRRGLVVVVLGAIVDRADLARDFSTFVVEHFDPLEDTKSTIYF